MTSPNAANTNIVWHAGRLLALWEGGPPHALDPRTLETLGPYDFGGKLAGAMTAHPKLDPETGEMLFFGYGFVPPFLRYHVVRRTGRLRAQRGDRRAGASMMHDFVVTRDHVIFLVFPAMFRLENVEKGLSPLGWEPELGTRIGVMPRAGGSRDVVWFEIDPCYVFHPMNAWSDGERVVADVCRYARVPLFDDGKREEGMQDLSAKLTRWTLDLASGDGQGGAPSTTPPASSRASTSGAPGCATATATRRGPRPGRASAPASTRSSTTTSTPERVACTGCRRATSWASRSSCRAPPTRRRATASCSPSSTAAPSGAATC